MVAFCDVPTGGSSLLSAAALNVPTEEWKEVDVHVTQPSTAAAFVESFSSALFRGLSRGGKLAVSFDQGACPDWEKPLETGLLLAGFTDFHLTRVGSNGTLTCSKPAWQPGQATRLTAVRPKASSSSSPAPALAPLASGVQLVPAPSSSFADLIDEDALLEGDVATTAAAGAGDCSTKRRACKNCSCGRAESEAAVVLDPSAPAPTTTSACGSCWKGDAFRCATCPHLGKPAFKAGVNGAVLLDTTASDI